MKRWIDFSFGRKGYGKVGKRKAAFQLSHSHDYYEIPSVMGYGFKGQVHRGLQARRKGTSSFSAWSPNRRPESKTHDLEETTLPLLLKSARVRDFQDAGKHNNRSASHIELEAVLGNSLDRITRYQSLLKKDFYRAIDALRAVQKEKRELPDLHHGLLGSLFGHPDMVPPEPAACLSGKVRSPVDPTEGDRDDWRSGRSSRLDCRKIPTSEPSPFYSNPSVSLRYGRFRAHGMA